MKNQRYLDSEIPLTPRVLYALAVEAGLADERIRICDGMAVSYFPCMRALAKSKNRIIIDVSAEEPVEFDELSADDMGIQYRLVPPNQLPEVLEWVNSHAKNK